jgi:hypothetical protein
MSEDVTRLRWLCENCDTVNETTLEYYVERSEAVGDEETCYNDYCEVCARGVWDVREQPKPSDEPSVEAGAEVGGGEHRDLLLDD